MYYTWAKHVEGQQAAAAKANARPEPTFRRSVSASSSESGSTLLGSDDDELDEDAYALKDRKDVEWAAAAGRKARLEPVKEEDMQEVLFDAEKADERV